MTAEAALTPTFDPYDYAIHEDPYPTYARLRAEAPVYHNPRRDFWALSRHADVLAAFRDADRFSSADGVSLDASATGPQAAKVMSFLAMDEPRHGQLRRLVSKGFTPSRVQDLEPKVRAITDSHLAAAIEAGSFDFIEDLAAKVPMDVVSELLGVPDADRAELRRLADVVVHREDGVYDVPPAAASASMELAVYYLDLIEQRRRAPKHDLTSALLEVELDGQRLGVEDIAAFLFLMVVAGNETTTKLLGHCWYWGWRHPEQLAKPFHDGGRVPHWVEETVRYDASTQILARTTTTPVQLHDQEIPAAARVLLLIGAANRDERVFDHPDRYDLDRDTTASLSFGTGRHVCLGAALARLEARVVLEQLLARVRSYEIDEAGARRVHSVNVRGFDRLPTTVSLR
jgi:cytochrome P450